jgi:hypothetical protein
MPVTLTYWRYHIRYTDEEDSLTDALQSARHGEDAGEMSVESITKANGEVLNPDDINRLWKRHEELEKQGLARERARHEALFIDNSHVITWKEASMLIRRCRWTPLLCTERGIPFLAANRWREVVRIASMANVRTMTPAQFWERLRKLDPNRVAQVERNSF